jgi:hypothetical protein
MPIDLSEYGDTLFDKGIPGMEVDINISSIANYNNGTTPLSFGVAVAIDADGKVQLPAAGGTVAGAVVRHVVFEADSDGETHYAPYAPIPVMEFGRIWVTCKDGCSVGEAVKADTDGTWSSAAGALDVAGAFWDSKAAAGEIAILRLNRAAYPASAAPPAEETRTTHATLTDKSNTPAETDKGTTT